MESETITEAFSYLDSHPGCLSFSERAMILTFQKDWNEHKHLTELQERTLLSLKYYRERQDKHLY